MYRIRPIEEKDFKALKGLSLDAQLGMTNLPKSDDRLTAILIKSITSFKSDISTPGDEYYLFILEDTSTQKILGVSGIYATTGPLHYFAVNTYTQPALFSDHPTEYHLIERVEYERAPSELCSLFLAPSGRHLGLGKLLSLSRLLFISAFRHRFTDEIFADLRGVIHEDGSCPFWDTVGRHFIPISFKDLMKYRDAGNTDIFSLMPKHPIYMELLPVTTIGETHLNTRPAMQMLLNEGFEHTNEIDLFDAGPRMIAKIENLKTVMQVRQAKVAKIKKQLTSSPYLISNHDLNFRATIGQVELLSPDTLALDEETMDNLEIKVGDPVDYAPHYGHK